MAEKKKFKVGDLIRHKLVVSSDYTLYDLIIENRGDRYKVITYYNRSHSGIYEHDIHLCELYTDIFQD